MFKTVELSLENLLGGEYVNKVAAGMDFFGHDCASICSEKVSFYPEEEQKKVDKLLDFVGKQILSPFTNDNEGAATASYKKAFHKGAAPICGYGPYRIGENGKLYFVGKSEHYHASLGHNFKGYDLIDHARKLGVLNATHNNTRGYITRLLERELIRVANDIAAEDEAALERILSSTEDHVLNRVISLETGSLAVEAGIKMMLGRFYALQKSPEQPSYADRIPVFLVMADNMGGTEANYHGTTVLAQTLRNMWPVLCDKMADAGIYKVVSVKINDIEDFERKIKEYNTPPYKTAGFLHEIVLMNYGGILLNKAYLKKAYALCDQFDTPKLADEIQSCLWYKGLYLFKKYELTPDIVIIGKGFSGGEYPASKVLTTATMDNLSQFGALVTNGQEELASLAYLISMRFVLENGEIIEKNQTAFFDKLGSLKKKHPETVDAVAGLGYLAAIRFYNVDTAVAFVKKMEAKCIDVSAQAYKANCPPSVLMKIPMIVSEKAIEFLVEKMSEAITELEAEK